MKHYKSIFIFSFILLLGSCKEPCIIGHWQLQQKFSGDSKGIDLIIKKDSTYEMLYDNGVDTLNIPGWHDDNMSGTWYYPDRYNLYLFPNVMKVQTPKEWLLKYPLLGLQYKIIRLTNKKMILEFNSPGPTDVQVPLQKYKRI
jgi:hypothetical protein